MLRIETSNLSLYYCLLYSQPFNRFFSLCSNACSLGPFQMSAGIKKYLNTKILLEFIFFIYSLFFIKKNFYFISDSIFLLTRMKESTLNFVDDPCAVFSFFASQRSKMFTLFFDLVKKYHTTSYQIKCQLASFFTK